MLMVNTILSSNCIFSGPIEEQVENNRCPEIDLTKVTPTPFSHLSFKSANPVDFKLAPSAIADPDGDKICYLWIWDYNADDPLDYRKIGNWGCSDLLNSEYKVYPCSKNLKELLMSEKYHLLELVYADREIIPSGRIVPEGGFIQSIWWWIEITPGICEGL